jgi:hypothetical protein
MIIKPLTIMLALEGKTDVANVMAQLAESMEGETYEDNLEEITVALILLAKYVAVNDPNADIKTFVKSPVKF